MALRPRQGAPSTEGAAMPPLPSSPERVSPLLLADRLLDLARRADRAGYAGPASRLMGLALEICEEPAVPRG
jgi:hypothetical protein